MGKAEESASGKWSGVGHRTLRDTVDRLSGLPQIAQNVVTVDVDDHPEHEQKKTCRGTNRTPDEEEEPGDSN